MLKFKLFKGIALLIIAFGVLSALLSMHSIKSRVVQEAQNRVRLDLNSAWAVYNQKLREIRTISEMVASKHALQQACRRPESQSRDDWEVLRNRLEKTRINFDLDFLTLAAADDRVLLRTAPPYHRGGFVPAEPAIMKALRGNTATCTTLFSENELRREAEGLAEQAFMPLEDTPHARPTPKRAERRGMVMLAAVPVRDRGVVIGVVYGGTLLTRNPAIIDRIQDVVFKEEAYEGVPLGTVTIFLKDSRIATSVRTGTGNRAYGTRVSKEVADHVLDNGRKWVGRAFVVHDWYLTAYDPIRDLTGEVIGMLYVGILETPFTELGRTILLRHAGLSGVALLAALILAFIVAGRIANPLHRLALAARRRRRGEYPPPIEVPEHASREAVNLIQAFNEMSRTLESEEAELRNANEQLMALNRNYMETVEFVSHELKGPVSIMVNYSYMLHERLLGDLNSKQGKAVGIIDDTLKRLSEMIRHYLNLARIENNELNPVCTPVNLAAEIVEPLIEAGESELRSLDMKVENRIPDDAVAHCDLNMIREVFENLFSNAMKYGRRGGTITLSCQVRDKTLECAVRNEGEGISEEEAERLFKKFSRLEGKKPQRDGRGTGLGLFITRQIIHAHGGSIRVDSEPGHWVEFCFSLPRHVGKAHESDGGSDTAISGHDACGTQGL